MLVGEPDPTPFLPLLAEAGVRVEGLRLVTGRFVLKVELDTADAAGLKGFAMCGFRRRKPEFLPAQRPRASIAAEKGVQNASRVGVGRAVGTLAGTSDVENRDTVLPDPVPCDSNGIRRFVGVDDKAWLAS